MGVSSLLAALIQSRCIESLKVAPLEKWNDSTKLFSIYRKLIVNVSVQRYEMHCPPHIARHITHIRWPMEIVGI